MSNSILSGGSMRVFSQEIALKIGMNEAILLQQVHYWLQISEHEYEGRKWVYNTYQDWQKQFPYWSLNTVKRIVMRLEKMGLLLSDNFNRMKMDRTKWYSINYEKLAQLDGSFVVEKSEEAETLWSDEDVLDEAFICSNGDVEHTSESKAIPKITSEITTKKEKNIKKSEVIAEVIAYLNEKTNSSYKPSVKKNQNVISARLREGFSIEDFKKVIDIKTEEWGEDRKWSKFLRPTTLFGTRFEAYLNQKYSSDEMREEDYDFSE